MPNVIKFTGYFAERAEELSVKVDIPKTNSILTAVVGALVGQPEGVRLAALFAMNHMLPFAKKNFAVDGERNFIIQRLHDCAVPAIQVQGADGTATAFPNSAVIRESALECCTRIVKLYYEKIDQNYVVAIYHITNPALDLKTNTPYEVMLQAINFWSTLAQVEAHFEDAALAGETCVSKKLAVAAADTVLPQLLACILGEGRDYREDDPDTKDDDYNPYTAAAECLKHFSCLMKSDILPHVTPFFGNFRSTDWKARDAALFAFAQVMEGPQENADPSKDIASLIAQCCEDICCLLQVETSHTVRDSAAFALGCAVKHFPHAVLRVFKNPDQFYIYTVGMLDPLHPAANKPSTVKLLWALRDMVEAVHLKTPDQHILPGSEIIFQFLISIAERFRDKKSDNDKESDLRAQSYEVLCDCIRCCSNDMLPHVKDVLLADLVRRLGNTLSAPQSSAIDANTRVVLANRIFAVGSIFTRFLLTPKATADLAAHLKAPLSDGSSMADTVTKCFIQALPADAKGASGISGYMCAREVVLALSQMSKIVVVDFEKYLPVLNSRLLPFMPSIENSCSAKGVYADASRLLIACMAAAGGYKNPLHPDNIRAVPYPDARVTLAHLPKEQSELNDLCATVVSITLAKSSSGATKVPLLLPPCIFLLPPVMRGPLRLIAGQLLVKLDRDGKRVNIPESMCIKILQNLLVVDDKPIDIFISPRDPWHRGPLS
jgi:hypothetical protein